MAKKNMRSIKKTRKSGMVKNTYCKNTVLIIVVLVVAFVFVGWFISKSSIMDDKESFFNDAGTDSRCPQTIKFENNVYQHLKNHDTIIKGNSGYGSCDFDYLSCIYGRNCATKKLSDGKRVWRVWHRSPVCGRDHYNKSFRFCDKNDLVAVHLNIEDNNKIVAARKINCGNCNNNCANTYGISEDKRAFNNGSITSGISGFSKNAYCKNFSKQESDNITNLV